MRAPLEELSHSPPYLEVLAKGVPPARVPEGIGCLAHVLRPARQHHLRLSELDLLRKEGEEYEGVRG